MSDDCRFGYFIPKADGTIDIVVNAAVLPREVLDELEKITSVVHYLQPIVLAWDAVSRNHGELVASVETFHDALHAAMKSGNTIVTPVLLDGLATIAQKLGNFLASASAFLSQTERRILRVRGPQDQASWNSQRHGAHSASFAYRLLYELRNFAQHYEFPLSTLDITGVRPSAGEDMTFEASPRLMRDTLLAEDYNWKSVGAEIATQPEKIDVMPLCAEYGQILRMLCIQALAPEWAALQNCARYFGVVAKKIQIPPDAVPILTIGHVPGTPPTNFSVLPFDQLRWLMGHLGPGGDANA